MNTSQLKTNKKKKVLSMLLALTMIFQISIPAVFAEGEENQKKIIAFEELEDDVKNITVEVDSTEEELVAKMPSSLKASYQETTTGSAIEITIENVTWELDETNIDSATFDSSQSGASYTYKAKLPATDMVSQQERPVPRPRPLAPGVRYVRVPSIQEILAAKSAAAEERRLAEIAALAAEDEM